MNMLFRWAVAEAVNGLNEYRNQELCLQDENGQWVYNED